MVGEPAASETQSTGRAPGRLVLGAMFLTAAAVVAFAVSTVPGVRTGTGWDARLDGWLQGGAYVLIAVVAVLRPLLNRHERHFWSLLAGAVVLRSAGFVLFLSLVRRLESAPYPSVADGAWLASGVLLAYVVWKALRPRGRELSRSVALDALLGALAVAGVAIALMSEVFHSLPRQQGSSAALVTNFVYPVIDVALLILVGGLVAAARGRLAPGDLTLGAGVVAIAVVDVIFLVQVLTDSFRPGTLLGALSLAGTALLAASGWVGDRTPPRARPADRGLMLPSALALVCLLTLVYGAASATQFFANLIAALGLVVALVRVGSVLAADRLEASAALASKQLELRRFQSLVEASGDFVALADPEGSMVYLNPAGRALVGLPADVDVRSMTVLDFLTPESAVDWREVRRPGALARGVVRGETMLRHHQGGPPVPVAVTTFEIRHPATGASWMLGSIQKDISERVAAERAVQRLADERSVLLSHLVQAQEDERARIAADVHDDSVQALAAVELRLATLRGQLAGDGVALAELLEALDVIRETASGATERLRHLLFDLESPVQQTDLATALDEAASFTLENEVGWSLAVEGDLDLPTATRVTVYRIAKEALANVRKHAQARHVAVHLSRDEEGLTLTVVDDGRGFDAAAEQDRPGHLGLPGMRDRAAVAGGRVDIDTRPGAGTSVRLWLPLGDASLDRGDTLVEAG